MQLTPRKQHIFNSANVVGKDYVVGDIHGQIQSLYTQLNALSFNFKTDRLFCTGDLISRGDESIECINLLTKKWFFSVMGNHEQLFLLGFQSTKYWDFLRQKGGEWLSQHILHFELLIRWKTLIEITMPLARTINVNGKSIGISHASAIPSWKRLQVGTLSDEDIWHVLWSRPLLYSYSRYAIDDVDYVVHGHSPVDKVTCHGNRYWIDTFSLTQELSIINLNELSQ
ncbi:metallophosphoesterase [Shewanella ulleungensis]|uniref:metallophosphoesterase n=1 Tax=Shewanella ulleungensis TaxID=2282699 RepID=UPI003D7B80E3